HLHTLSPPRSGLPAGRLRERPPQTDRSGAPPRRRGRQKALVAARSAPRRTDRGAQWMQTDPVCRVSRHFEGVGRCPPQGPGLARVAFTAPTYRVIGHFAGVGRTLEPVEEPSLEVSADPPCRVTRLFAGVGRPLVEPPSLSFEADF